MPRTIGDITHVSDGWLREFAGVSLAELDNPATTPERRAFVADAADRISAEMVRRGIERMPGVVIPFRPRVRAYHPTDNTGPARSIDDLWPNAPVADPSYDPWKPEDGK